MQAENRQTPGWTPLSGGTGFVLASWRERFAFAGLKTIDDFLEAEGEALSKPGLGTRYRARLRLRDQLVYLKRFNGDRFFDRFRRWREDGAWHSPAEREWRTGEALLAVNIEATRALAWGRQDRDGVERSFVVLSAAPGEPADRFLERPHSMATLREVTRRMAAFARCFHAAGWRHRDFYLCHIFVRENGPGRFELTLIDLQRVFQPHWITGRWRVKDLAQLAYSVPGRITPRLRLRFCRDYFAGETRAVKRRRLRAVQAKVEAMVRRAKKTNAI